MLKDTSDTRNHISVSHIAIQRIYFEIIEEKDAKHVKHAKSAAYQPTRSEQI